MSHFSQTSMLGICILAVGCSENSKSDVTACTPSVSCESAGAKCGSISNGCGVFLHCGTCEKPQTCGGGHSAFPMTCGCTPLTCEQMGADCGGLDDGCGGIIQCGTCDGMGDFTCGGAGRPNVCGFPVCQDGYCYQSGHPTRDTQFGVFRDPLGKVWTVGVFGSVYVREQTNWKSILAYTRTESDLKDIWIFSDRDGWAVGENGAILRFDGDWLHCQYLDDDNKTVYWSPVEYNLNAIWATGENDVWAVGAEGILHFDGLKWTVAKQTPGPLFAILGLADGTIVAAGSTETKVGTEPLFMMFDGDNWNRAPWTEPLIKGEIRGIAEDPANRLYAVGRTIDARGKATGGLVLVSDGDAWRVVGSGLDAGLLTATSDPSGLVWFGGEKGLFGFTNGETAEESARIFGDQDINALISHGEGMSAVGANGLIGTYDGFWDLNRQHVPVSVGDATMALWERAQNDVWAGGDGFILHWNGSTWKVAPVRAHILGFYGVSHDTIYSVGNRPDGLGVVYRFDGKRLAEVERIETTIIGVEGTSPWDIRVLTGEGKIHHFDGEAWREREGHEFSGSAATVSPESEWTLDEHGFVRDGDEPYQTEIWPFDGLQQTPRASWGMTDRDIWAGGDDGLIHFDGNRWKKVLRAGVVTAIDGSANDDVWFAGRDDGGAALWNWDGKALSSLDIELPGEEWFTDISITPDGDIYVSGNNIYRHDMDSAEIVYAGQGEIFTSVHAFSKNNIWTTSGINVHVFDGISWNVLKTPDLMDLPPFSGNTNAVITQIFPLDPELIFFMGGTDDGNAAVLLVYDHGEWSDRTFESLGGTATFTDIWGSSPEHIYVTMGELGYIYRYRHDVRFFTEVWGPIAEPLTAIWGTPDNEIWVFGQYGAILANRGYHEE